MTVETSGQYLVTILSRYDLAYQIGWSIFQTDFFSYGLPAPGCTDLFCARGPQGELPMKVGLMVSR